MGPTEIVWKNVILLGLVHFFWLHNLYNIFTFDIPNWKTCIFDILLGVTCGYGITAGAHRLWTHRSYKAKLPLRIFLCFLHTTTSQGHLYDWVRDHRVHHKFSETDADPHNSNRGFFFSHVGWLMCRKHPDVIAKGKSIDMSDIDADPVVSFQRKYYMLWALCFCFVIPTLLPWYCWSENLYVSWCATMCRFGITLHLTWLVNSAAHMYGFRPYDKFIKPTENYKVAFFTCGEGFHNYHHAFPWDYKTGELGNYFFNSSALFIDMMAAIGLAYDLRTATAEVIQKRIERTGADATTDEHAKDNLIKIQDNSCTKRKMRNI